MTEQRETSTDWQEEARSLGVDPNEPDDHRYWSLLDARKAIIDSFRYHQPSEAQIDRIAAVRRGHVELAMLIMRSTPASADQTAALRKLHECMMTANKAIICEKKV